MSQIVSCSKKTLLHDFPDLKILSKYDRQNEISTDFQFFNGKKMFLESNKKYGIELMRIKNVDGKDKISLVRKIRVENLFCAACPKKYKEEVAVGLTSGHINCLNYKTSDFVKQFNPSTLNSSVIFMDYSPCDDYLSGVYENGAINIFGLRTGIKLDSLQLDNGSTLARFHPTKKFHLAIASNKGSVTVFDFTAKRKSFHYDAHAAPCRDVCMSPVHPDCLVTVGYDTMINIFDIRKKTLSLQIRHEHPFSSISLSDCGLFCCAGNLKGEIICYDFRNLKTILSVGKVHEGAIERVAFVPNDSKQTESESGYMKMENTCSVDSPTKSTVSRKSILDGIGDEIDVPMPSKRDSFWNEIENYNRMVNLNHSPTARLSMESRLSMGSTRLSGFEMGYYDDSFENSGKVVERKEKPLVNLKRRSSIKPVRKFFKDDNLTDALENINEEKCVSFTEPLKEIENKENHSLNVSDSFSCIKNENNSTPQAVKKVSFVPPVNGMETDEEVEVVKQRPTNFSVELEVIRNEFDEKLKLVQNDLLFNADGNKWSILNQNSMLSCRQDKANDEIMNALNVLMNKEMYVAEFMRLKRENEELKKLVAELQRK